ncbi:MAG: MATE family efflux transporter [Paludibacteraceae bacterium]|nr:MATE family efflux transporter [Paludibacteraceae bacterium]
MKEYFPYYKRNLKVAFPVMMTQIGASLVGLFDSIMVGHYATADLAAVSFSNAIFFTVMVFSMGALMGITPLIGVEVGREANGKDCSLPIAYIYRNGVVFTLLLSAIMLGILGSIIPFLHLFGQEDIVVQTARPYYILIVISIVPFLFFCLYKQLLEGLGNTWIAMVITLCMNLLNIGLNYILIFGKLGFPAMGATGAGIATLVSRAMMPVIFWVVVRCKQEWKRYRQFRGLRLYAPLREGLKQLWQIGAPIGLQTTMETILFTLSFIIIGWLNKESLAAHQIANQIADLTFMLALGIGSATTIRVSHQLGKGDLHAVRMASNASIHLVLAMNTIGAVLMISLRNYIPLLFTNDTEVIPIASGLILIAGFFQYADGLQCVGAAMLRGITDVKMPMIYATISYLLISLPLGLLLMFPCGLGAQGMWISFIVGLSCAAILFHIRFRKKLHEMQE